MEMEPCMRGGLFYNGNNTFIGGVNDIEARFELQSQWQRKGSILVFREDKEINLEGTTHLKYKTSVLR